MILRPWFGIARSKRRDDPRISRMHADSEGAESREGRAMTGGRPENPAKCHPMNRAAGSGDFQVAGSFGGNGDNGDNGD